jgi:hypothetical protein
MTVWQWIGDALWTSIPVVGVGLFVWLLFRSIIRADATERKVYAEIEAEERERLSAAARYADAVRETTTGVDKAESEQAGSKGK